MRLIAFLLLGLAFAPGATRAEAVAQFSPTGPDAAAYGQAEGYPVHAIGPHREQRYLVGAFSHDDQLIRQHPVAAAPGPVPLARAPQELALTYQYRGRSYTLADYLARNPATGLLILRGRTILYEHYQYGRTDHDRFLSQSMAKTVTAMLVGIALNEGKIHSLDDRAALYVPELAGSVEGEATIRDLLHMASGLAYREAYDGADDSVEFTHLLWRRDSPGTVATLRHFDTREAPSGTRFHYKGPDPETLGLVLKAATGMSLADQLSSHIWTRIGTEAPASWGIDASGQEAAFCCVSATLRDWGRLGALLANNGAWDGQQIIPHDWLLAATTTDPAGPFAPRVATKFWGYGYLTWIFPPLPGLEGRRLFALHGVHGQAIYVDPASKLVLVHTAVRKMPAGDPGIGELIALWGALVRQEGTAK